jgi:ring-1,2-phenylacetyl-CoA epoxidase subunit PaaE
MTPKFHPLKIKDIRPETDDAVSIGFDVPENLKLDYSFKAGQYLTFKAIINGEEVRRSYSLCTSPLENKLRVAVKRVLNGKFSNFAIDNFQVGQEIEVMTPTGNFKFQPERNTEKSYLLFASGSGITPIISIMKTILHEEPKSDVTFFYGNKNFNSIIFREEIEALKNQFMNNLRVIHILSRESLGNEIQKGRITKEKVDQLYNAFIKDNNIDGIYICGPEEMILGVKESLSSKGISEKQIHFELFASSVPKKEIISESISSEAVDSMVSIILDGDRIDIPLRTDGDSILDAAQKAGADLPFACKGGVCCTCKAKILEGSAKMDVNYALEKDEVEAGYILTCQAHPTSEKLLVSFDD